jgi:predicted enzyme related to lactoylglutathione lyase
MVDVMNLVSIRIITADVDRLTAFYERATGITADRPTPDFSELRTPSGTLAIGSTRTVGLFGPGSAEPAANRSAIVEFIVDDVDATAAALDGWAGEFVSGPTTLPWGNRSLLVRDPDGTLVNFFTPVSPDAIAKFADVAR